jgi:hypothetical protein
MFFDCNDISTAQRKRQAMNCDVLIVSTMEGAANCAQAISEQMNVRVEVAANLREALTALRQREFGVVVVEENLVEVDPEAGDQIWALAGLALPLQINFARSGSARLIREVKAALNRRDGEHALARRAATAQLEKELKTSVTGLLLESELVLREPATPISLQPRLRHLVELAGVLRERLRGTDGLTRA